MTIRATRRLRTGRPVIMRDDNGSTGHLVLAADLADVAGLAFMIRYCSGFVRVALTDDICDGLLLPAAYGAARLGGRQCVAVDAIDGVGTGISARDRARTIARLAAADARPDEFTRPGHVVSMRVDPSAPVGDAAEHAYRLARLAGARGAAFDTLVPLDTPVSSTPPGGSGTDLLRDWGLDAFAHRFGVPIVDMADIRRAVPHRIDEARQVPTRTEAACG